MGTRGPKPMPANVHQLRGNPSGLTPAQLEARRGAQVEVAAPTCPAHIVGAARTEWRRIVPLLVQAGLIAQLDRAAIAQYCQAYGEWVQLSERACKLAVKKPDKDPGIDVTPSGYKQISVLYQLRDRAADRVLRLAREFGLTPSARSAIGAPAAQQPQLPGLADPMEALLQAGAGAASVS